MKILERISGWVRPSPEEAAARRLYAALMAQARQKGFYEEGAVADTVDGRFDLVVVHLFLVMRRLKSEGKEGAALTQHLLNTAFGNFDEALREMGVGDLSVPKKIKKMAEAFYGRAKAYEEALASGEAAFGAALRRNLYRSGDVEGAAIEATKARLTAFLRRLEASTRAELLSGALAGGAS